MPKRFSPALPARRRLTRCAVALFVALAGCTVPPAATPAIPLVLSPNMARIWVYRSYEPYETLARPLVRFNGEPVGVSEPGGTLVRDVSPGVYRVTVDSTGRDTNQFVTVTVAAGATVYIKIESAQGWESDLERRVDTFYTREVLPDTAARPSTGRQ